jgi:hypothetical protein
VYKLEFADPIDITPYDLLKVTTNFTSFNPGLTVPVREVPCSRQVVNGTATQSVEAASAGTQAATLAAGIGSAIMQTAM